MDRALHDARRLESLLRPFPAEHMQAHPVSSAVNSPWNNSPEWLEQVPPRDA